MGHRYEELNKRDRYMVGDWVLCKGEPYQWKVDDYLRSRIGMQEIEDIPLTKEILFANGFRKNGLVRVLVHNTDSKLVVYYKVDHFEGVDNDWIVKSWDVTGITGFKYVYDFQHYLRLISRFDMADNFKLV